MDANPQPTPRVNPWIVAVSVMFATFLEVLDTTGSAMELGFLARTAMGGSTRSIDRLLRQGRHSIDESGALITQSRTNGEVLFELRGGRTLVITLPVRDGHLPEPLGGARVPGEGLVLDLCILQSRRTFAARLASPGRSPLVFEHEVDPERRLGDRVLDL